MLIEVKPGIVLISLSKTRPEDRSMKKSARAMPRQPISSQVWSAIR
jgi:hypothetical protein